MQKLTLVNEPMLANKNLHQLLICHLQLFLCEGVYIIFWKIIWPKWRCLTTFNFRLKFFEYLLLLSICTVRTQSVFFIEWLSYYCVIVFFFIVKVFDLDTITVLWTLYIIEVVYAPFLLDKLAFSRLVQRVTIEHWSMHWSQFPHRLCHLFVVVLIDGCLVLEYDFAIILLLESIWAYQLCQLPLQLDLFHVKFLICSFNSYKKRVIY